jgi:hypothetical protein
MKTLEIKKLSDKAIKNLDAVKGGDGVMGKKRMVNGENTSMP